MTVCIGFHAGDVVATQRLLRWIAELGGCLGHECLLISDAATPYNDVLTCQQIANDSFSEVAIFSNDEPTPGWIAGSNSLFLTAARYCAGKYFLWLEPDATPLKHGWLNQIEAAYQKCGKPYMGPLIRTDVKGLPSPYLEGVAVYPANALQRLGAYIRSDVSWTFTTAAETVPNTFDTPLIHHIWGEFQNPPVFAQVPIYGTAVFGLQSIRKEAVIFHRNKDGSLIDVLRSKRGPVIPKKPVVTYSHGGDVGDLIYGLCAIKAAGGGDLAITRHAVRDVFTQKKADLLLPLLSVQPYIHYADYHETPVTPFGSDDKPEFVDVALDKFREVQFHRRHHGHWENIAQTHLRLLGLPLEKSKDPWLVVDDPVSIPGRPVVFHRSPRYNNPAFPWARIAERYRNQAVFVGSPSEHSTFCRSFGYVPYHPTATYLDLARVIAGSKLFVGNQACPYAMAEGLHANAILECSTWCPDCVFERPNLIVGKDQNVQLPNVA